MYPMERTLVGRAGEHGVEDGAKTCVVTEAESLLWQGTPGRSLLGADM